MPSPTPSPFNRNPSRLPSQPVPQYLLDCFNDPASPRFELPELLKDSLYYPACGLNGTPIKHLSGFVHSFVYADYWISEEDYLRDLYQGTALLGYRCMHERSLETHDIVPTGWRPPILPPRDKWERLQRQESRAKPFGRWSLWQRLPDFSTDHGPECLSLLFFGGEMSALYQGLYNRLEIAPKVIALIQPGAIGGEWERPVSPDSFFKQVVNANSAGLPQYLLRGRYDHGHSTTSEWPEFQHQICNIHERSATLWGMQ